MQTSQPKQIVKDVFGELLETGKATAKASGKAASDIASQAVKTVFGHKPQGSQVKSKKSLPDRLDWLEKMGGNPPKAKVAKLSEEASSSEDIQKKQIAKMNDVDKRQSMQAYKQIQQEIEKIRRAKESQPRKYETGKNEFDEEQVKDPDSFFEKMKKKQEEVKKNLPWNKKKPGGTGEMQRGASG